MTRRPGRAKMCSWLAGALGNLVGVMPFNPADVKQMAINANDADERLRALAAIAAELGWHADADLDEAWRAIQEYERRPRRVALDEYAPDRIRVAPGRTTDRENGSK